MAFKFLDHLDRYPPVIAREQIGEYFPWLSAKTVDEHERRGEGPSGVFYNGAKKIYPTAEFLSWLDTRSTIARPRRPATNPKSTQRRTNEKKIGRKTKQQARRERLGLDQ